MIVIPPRSAIQWNRFFSTLGFLKTSVAALSCVVCLCVLGVPAATAEDPMDLSLQSAVFFALEESMRIGVSEEQAVQAEHAIDEARSSYFPQVEVSSEIGAEYNDPGVYKAGAGADGGNITSAGGLRFSMRQMIFDGPAIAEVDRRKKVAEAADVMTVVTSQQVISDAVKIYLDIYKFQNEYTTARNLVKSLDYYVNRLKQAVGAGAESEAKYKYAKARLDLAMSRSTSAAASVNESVHKLQRYTGPLPEFSAMRPVELDLLEYDIEFLEAMAVTQNPELLLADFNIEASKLDVKRQNREYLPKVNFVMEGRHDQNFGEVREREGRAMVQIKYDIFKGGAREASKKRLLSRVKEMEYEKEDMLREIKTDLSTAYSEILSDKEKAALKQKEVLSYIDLQKINQEALDQGDLDIFEVIENEERLGNAQSELNQLDVNLYKKSYELLQHIGALKKQRFCESC